MANEPFYKSFLEKTGTQDYYLKHWIGKGGYEYLRNEAEHQYWINDVRLGLWRDVFSHTPDLKSVLEVGCGTGRNLKTIGEHFPEIGARGIEPQPMGCYTAQNIGVDVEIGKAQDIPKDDNSFDMVFTFGVLIHIGPHLKKAFEEMFRVSKRYILIAEYIQPEWESFAADYIRKGPFDKALEQACPVREIYRCTWTEWINENIDDKVEVRLYAKDDGKHMAGTIR